MRNGFCPIGTEFKAYGTVYTDCAGERCELFVTTGLNEDGSACGRCSIRLIAEMMMGVAAEAEPEADAGPEAEAKAEPEAEAKAKAGPEAEAKAEAKPEQAELELDGSAEGKKKGK